MRFQLPSLAAGILAVATSLMAQQGPGMNMRMYNPSTEKTIKGVIEDVTAASRGSMMMMGTHLSVKTADGLATVALGPASFISSSGFKFAKGDSVEITGSQVTMGGEEWIIAREVTKDGKTLTLRDKDGNPKWAGGMMGRGAPKSQ
jgi:hypothetical protein